MTTDHSSTVHAPQPVPPADHDRGAAWPVYILAVLGPPLAMWVVTHSLKRAATCAIVSMLTLGIGGVIMAVLAARRRSPRWAWKLAPLSERLVLVVGIMAGVGVLAAYA
jgi:hypothetical protein